MKETLALQILGELMSDWSDSQAISEFAWLRLMSRLKYDGYQGYLAGVRFLESLIIWLHQFEPGHRDSAYRLVKTRLCYISGAEISRLVERFYRTVLQAHLMQDAAAVHNIASYRVWSTDATRRTFQKLRRQTLLVGLSDGARTDILRRANVGVLSNEQVVLAPLVDDDKWRDLSDELQKDTLLSGVKAPKFTRVYLLDDLNASGTTLIRHKSSGEWGGKLPRFRKAIRDARTRLGSGFPLDDDLTVCVHHYIATETAFNAVRDRCKSAAKDTNDPWYEGVQFTTGMQLPALFGLNASQEQDFLSLADTYYDGAALEDKHTKESGVDHMRYGYAGCALPLVLEHNTPNNSVSLLWADTSGTCGEHKMRPLFRRRTRHS